MNETFANRPKTGKYSFTFGLWFLCPPLPSEPEVSGASLFQHKCSGSNQVHNPLCLE
jgi:hypothetical protein